MADDLMYRTATLVEVVRELPPPPLWVLDRYFRNVANSATALVQFDVEIGGRGAAAFCSPLVEGRIVRSRGYKTTAFEPPYIKEKTPLLPGQAIVQRLAGEKIGGELSPADRRRAQLRSETENLIARIGLRQELMAIEGLLTGGVTCVGEKYPEVHLDFGRAAALRPPPVEAAEAWGASGVKPLDVLQDWATEISRASGATAEDVILAVDVWKVFRADADVQKRLERPRAATPGQELSQAAQRGPGVTFQGSIDGFNILTYAGWYELDDGTMAEIWPAGTACMASPQIEGVRHYGAIHDEEAGFRSLAYFPKSWVTNDPSVRWVMIQSAPCPVPRRINAAMARRVLAPPAPPEN